MPTDTGFIRPELTQLIARIKADINSRLSGADSTLRRSFLYVFTRILAGLTHGLYGYLDFIARQVFPDTAESVNLERWASIWGISKKAATKATGTVTFTGTSGSAINIGTQLQRGDGVLYKTTTATVLSAGSGTATIQAITAGEDGNVDSGALFTFVSPITGVDSEATASTDISGGTNTEEDEDLKIRLLERLQQPPHGGADFDYVAWAKECAGVTRAFVSSMEMGAGTVTVRPMMDNTYEDGIPEAGDITTIQAYIDTKRPVTATVYVAAPTATPLDFTIALKKRDGTSETSPTIKAAVEAELADMLRRDAEPGGTILISHIREAISIAAGEHNHVLSSPAADVTHTTGQIATMGTVTWV